MKKWIGIIVLLVVAYIAGLFTYQIFWAGKKQGSSQVEKKPLYWVAPMDPNYRRDKPGKSPMGMDLVPVYANQKNNEVGVIKISPTVENNLGVKVAKVEKRTLSRVIDTVGYVTVDENNIEHIHTYVDGWVKKLWVKTTGENVKKGQLLLELYSPTLNNAQQELLLAIKNNNKTLISAGIKKLKTLGVSQTQINQIKRDKKAESLVKVFATKAGIVSQLNVREGAFVKPSADLVTIEDLSRIWVVAEVFEGQSAWVKQGQAATATLSYWPGKVWQGRVDYVYPELDQKTHTLRVRLVFPNPDLTMKPKMYANIKIYSQAVQDAIAIPRLALIRSGGGDRVIVALGDGRFRAQPVKVGIESGHYYQVLSGLKPGESIVTSAQFLIDSESNIRASFDRINSDKAAKQQHKSHKLQEYVGQGVIMQVDARNRRVSIRHQPIPALDMPAMEMDLKVDTSVNLSDMKAGDELHFVMVKQPDGTYLVIKIHVMAKHRHGDQS